MALKNLGTVRAIHIGSSPPSNIQMIWYNNGINAYTRYKHHYYDTLTSAWRELGGKDKITSSLTNNTTTNIIVGTTTAHKSISLKYIVVRDNQVATGTIEIINLNSILQISEPFGRVVYGDDGEVGESAVVFSANYNSGNIRLGIALSDTGNNATIDLFNIDQIS